MSGFIRIAIALVWSISALPALCETWQPAPGHVQVPIWPGAAPDALVATQPESVGPGSGRQPWLRIEHVSQPTMTVYAPQGTSTRAAVVVFPGGGFRSLAIDLEGTEVCDWFTSRGVTCVLLKYRVPQSNHHWDDRCRCHVTPKVPRALQDAQRTIKVVRARAGELGLDAGKIGAIGFSAGGYLVAQTSTLLASAYKPIDEIDRLSSRPDFAVALYPGHLCRSGGLLDPSLRVTNQAPPSFLLQAWDDPVDPVCNTLVYARALDAASVPTEVHLFAKGGHAFGLRPQGLPVDTWPTLLEHWLRELQILKP